MEDVILHYKPGPGQDLSALIETTEKLLAPFPQRPPQVFSPWFLSIDDRHLPLRPARRPPRILSALNPTLASASDQTQTRERPGPKENCEIGPHCSCTDQHEPSTSKTPDRGVPYVPETPPDPTIQEPGLKVQEPGLKVQEPGLKGHEPGLKVQEPGLKVHKPGLKVQEPGLKVQEPGLKVQEPGLKVHEPGLKVQESGLQSHNTETCLQVQETRLQVQDSRLQVQETSLHVTEPSLKAQKPSQNIEPGLQVQDSGLKAQDTSLQSKEPGLQVQDPHMVCSKPESKPESPSKRCWTVFSHRLLTKDRTTDQSRAQTSVQAWSRKFQQTLSKLRLQSRQRVKWIIDRSNCRDIEQVWRLLSRPPLCLSLPSCCNAHIDRSLDQVWVYCDLLESEQVGLALKQRLRLRGRIWLWERTLGSVYSL